MTFWPLYEAVRSLHRKQTKTVGYQRGYQLLSQQQDLGQTELVLGGGRLPRVSEHTHLEDMAEDGQKSGKLSG